jgi:nucleoside-diphosphate-sugar epimerase
VSKESSSLQAPHPFSTKTSLGALRATPSIANCSRVWKETDWNPATWEDGIKGDLGNTYSVSKKVAEKAAWEFMETVKPHFSLITLMPPGVYGFVPPPIV